MKPRRHSVFVIEDNPFFTLWLNTELEQKAHYRVHNYLTVEEALHDLEKVRPGIVLLDYHFGPGKDGMDALLEIRRLLPESYVAVLSETQDCETAVDLMRMGANTFIAKNKNAVRALVDELH